MSTMTVEEMLLMMEADLDEVLGSFYGGRSVTSRWLREAYNALYSKLADVDKNGEWVGARTTANYTAGAASMAITTWSSRGTPLNLYDLRAGSTRIPFVSTLDFEDAALANASSGRYPYLANIFGQALYLSPVPVSALSLTMLYAPPPVKLYYEAVGGAIPAPPGGGTWLAYTPTFIPGYYEAIPAYAVVLAEMAEQKPNKDHRARADRLEEAFINYARRFSLQSQTQPAVRTDANHYMGYAR